MILANATIYTADPARPFADAMAVRGGRVLRIGTYESVKVPAIDASLSPPSDTLLLAALYAVCACRSSRVATRMS